MSKNSWRASLLAASLLAAGGAARAETHYGVFPTSSELFPRLLADPREIQLSAAYYHQASKHTADIALGHSWGMARWYDDTRDWVFQWDIEAMAYSRFKLAGSVNEFETIDFFGNLPIEVRTGPLAGKFMIFHQSSHLGDDYIRRTHDQGFRYSVDGVKGLLSGELFHFARLYGGGGYLLHAVPNEGRSFGQAGAELTTKELGLWQNYPSHLYAAQDLQWRQSQAWSTNFRTVVGMRIGFKGVIQTARVYLGYYWGHSPYGQFFRQKERRGDFNVAFDL